MSKIVSVGRFREDKRLVTGEEVSRLLVTERILQYHHAAWWCYLGLSTVPSQCMSVSVSVLYSCGVFSVHWVVPVLLMLAGGTRCTVD